MPHAETHCCWTWQLQSSPESLWPLVSDTDRFNRDCGFPAVTAVPPEQIKGSMPPDTRRLHTRRFGIPVEWDERPFEWISPRRFGVERVFHRGPFANIRALCDLTPTDTGGTTVTYQTWFTPANLPGQIALRLGAHLWQFRQPFGRVFRQYDRLAAAGSSLPETRRKKRLAPGAGRRLGIARTSLLKLDQSAPDIDRLIEFVTTADDLSVMRIRPYALADLWGRDRRRILQLFLHATRVGLLDFTWDILCPLCRGAKAVVPSLGELKTRVHCDACHIDFTTNLEQSVELTFHPNPTLREVRRTEYCVGGPQITPHIVAQQKVAPTSRKALPLRLVAGHYRLRTLPATASHFFRVGDSASDEVSIDLTQPSPDDLPLSSQGTLHVNNDSTRALRIILEHLGWTDQAATAREVTCMQTFRDLFAREVLRPGEQISVGSLTLVFTDIKGSTQLYREIGDAPAFGRVLSHFTVLRDSVASGGGAVVKTMGDAIMAAFPNPAAALHAMLKARQRLAHPQAEDSHAPLIIKVGLHHGPCIAINQNDRLDYFGSTVNLAARLGDLSNGSDLVISASVHDDPEVASYLANRSPLSAETVRVRGFDQESFRIWRLPGETDQT